LRIKRRWSRTNIAFLRDFWKSTLPIPPISELLPAGEAGRKDCRQFLIPVKRSVVVVPLRECGFDGSAFDGVFIDAGLPKAEFLRHCFNKDPGADGEVVNGSEMADQVLKLEAVFWTDSRVAAKFELLTASW